MSKIPLAGVIGCPVGHSRSPVLHGTWLRDYGIKGHYVPLHVEAKDLAAVLHTLPAMGFVGVNVTIPHKEAALALADTATPMARAIGAANTLSFVDGHIHADNTDGYGFMQNLRDGAPAWRAEGMALVLGAGGAARAVIVALADAGVPRIVLSNRTRARAEVLQAEIAAPVSVVDWAEWPQAAADAALVVNTTSLGMAGQPALDMPPALFDPRTVVTDLVYTPLETDLLRQARACGCVAVDGLGMLLHQAVPGFARWFGRRPQVSDALRAAVLGA
ncbi:shikimate dehydrogenase [Roseinatronobacter thiooxidans]|uniref:Shikimate dehydrogenase (NADP(+)) n=1 Tax=Roseinatronobacter thiooxidans TaxID=121821 RepID=A0A2W7QAY7_9RHOB|nr:shikimate dehydrogenase [Roseinatronobacter thiooxidans]PZX45858.1 shikimate dehydrogenase [Roseinatronobacter thiooxidans]